MFFFLQEIRISQLEIELDCCKIEKDQIGLQLEDYTTRYRHDKLLVVSQKIILQGIDMINC